ncbi:MAG TPA: NAD-dependent epimerase/dehydratase family protein [Bacillales bacterium]|nr:NAD-dependent epimerase/dehydratase family protein [Bacillales bacterium]
MKILVLGGTKFFGKKLVEKWIEAGEDVTIGTRGLSNDPFGDQVRRLTLDRSDLDSLQKAVGSETWDIVYDQIAYSSNDAWNAIDVFGDSIKKYVFTSSMSVYDQGEDLTEERFNPFEYPLKTGNRDDFSYGEGKKLAEAVFFQKAPFPVTAVRFPIVMGEDDYTERLLFHVQHIQNGEAFYLPNLQAKLSFISSEEAAEFLFWTGTSPLRGPVNACAGGDISLEELIRLIESSTGNKAVVSNKKEEADASPYGIPTSWTMDHSKASAAGFPFTQLRDWLPKLIEKLS